MVWPLLLGGGMYVFVIYIPFYAGELDFDALRFRSLVEHGSDLVEDDVLYGIGNQSDSAYRRSVLRIVL